MDEKRETEDGLPRATRDTVDSLKSIIRKSERHDKEESLNNFCRRVLKENPYIVEFFSALIDTWGEEDSRVAAFYNGSYFIYEALRRQAAANMLEKNELPRPKGRGIK